MQRLADMTCAQVADELSSSAPVPGGGGASALIGAIGVALGNMVGSLTAGKQKYADVADDIAALNERAASLRAHLLSLADDDAAAFEPLSRAYGLPAGTDDERAHKAAVMERCLRDAAAVPLAIMEACAEGIELCAAYADTGSALVRSDAACGAVACRAALEAASLNVFANTRLMADEEYARELEARADDMLARGRERADGVYERVSGRAS